MTDVRPKAARELFAGSGTLAQLMRTKNWSSTSLGPAEHWPQSLRTVVSIMLTSRYAMWMGWGKELNFFYNDAYQPTLGVKHDWALGARTDKVWEEIWDQIGPRIDHVLSHGEATWDEGLLLFLERSGYPEETYHTFSYSPITDDDGAIGGMLCVVTEETERKIAERRLALLRELGAQLNATDSAPQVFEIVQRCLDAERRDLPFSLLYMFEEGEHARLRARAGLPVGHDSAPSSVDLRAAASWPLERVLADNQPLVVEAAQLVPAANWPNAPWDKRPERALLVPIPQQGHSHPVGVLVAGLNPHRPLDATYRDFVGLLAGQIAAGVGNARAHDEERKRSQALAEIDRAKTQFFSNVSHEFRTPLTLMLGPISDLIDRSQLSAATRDQLTVAQRNGLRLLKLVNTMLDFSRIEAGRMQAHFEPVDLTALTNELASMFQSATLKAGLTLKVACKSLPELAYVDRDMWEKIVLNLLSNAFKFTLQGGIDVELEAAHGQAVLRVRDTGVGIAAHELGRVFERFHRVEDRRGRTHEGTGIGLAFVQELVRLHGGAVSAESVLDRGTTFTVTVPLGRDHLPREQIYEAAKSEALMPELNPFVIEALRSLPSATRDSTLGVFDSADSAARNSAEDLRGNTTGALAGDPLRRARILIVDDNADMRAYLERVLSGRHTLESVSNGKQALAAIQLAKPDLVITDVMMPELDGFGLLEALQADPRTRDVSVLMLSARAGEESRVEGLSAGASDYLVKPFSARELVARTEALLLRAHVRQLEIDQRQRLEHVFFSAPVGIAILRGAELRFELANPAYLRLIASRDVIGKPLIEALPELAGQGIFEILGEVYRSGKPYVGRAFRVMIQRRPDAAPEEVFYDFAYQPITDDTGRVDSIMVVAFEVTELANARREAEVANRAKDEFLALLGHELRNPLAPIVTALQLMRLRGGAEIDKERGIIERQVRHLVSLVDDLLDVSRITRGKIQLKLRRIELAEVVASAVETVSPLLEQRLHNLRVELATHGLAIDADPARMSQTIANLLTNAAKYTEPGGTISVHGYSDVDAVVLEVSDTGIGIDAEMLPHVFTPFAQGPQALDRSQGGLGLGLTIVHNFVTLHGGTVTVQSLGKDRGTSFVIRLPKPAARALSDRPPANDPETNVASLVDATRVLIVDDNQDAASLLAEVLSLEGYATHVAHDGPSALLVAPDFDPDIAILDIGLPVMDGFELARRFQEHPVLGRAHLIALTGYGQEQDRKASRAAGFGAHLVKPIDFDKLHRVLAGLGISRVAHR